MTSKQMNMLDGWDGVLRLHQLRRSLDAVMGRDWKEFGLKQKEMLKS